MNKLKLLSITTLMCVLFSMVGCSSNTTCKQDQQMLQRKYSTVYQINSLQYICIDTVGIYDVSVNMEGKIVSIVKIK